MSVNFENDDIKAYQDKIMLGGKASTVLVTEEWAWIEANIFERMKKDALILLRAARTDPDRLLAQQMYRACIEPKEQMEEYVREGQAAQEILKQLSNPETNQDEAES